MKRCLPCGARLEGAAQVCKYDNQKAVVLGWEGQQPIYNPRFLAFATHYEFRPHACRHWHPNDKPTVERSFWEFEKSFLNGRSFRDLDDMRAQLAHWLDRIVDHRLLDKLNASGAVFLSHTVLNGRFVLRLAIGNIGTTRDDVQAVWRLVQETASALQYPEELGHP